MIHFDVVLLDVGGVGLAQVYIFLILSYFNIPSGFNGVFTVFGAYRPNYRCNAPPIDNSTVYPNFTKGDILNLTTPHNAADDSNNTCYRYGYNLDNCTGDFTCIDKSSPPIKCDRGYSYDDSMFTETAVTEFDLVCDQRFWEPLSSSLYYAGMLIGSLAGGYFADAYGRKRCCFVSSALMIGCCFGISFSHSLALYVTFRILTALFCYSATLIAYVYIIEILDKEWRTGFAISSGTFYAMGYIILSGVAYNWRNWHEMMLVGSILAIPFFFLLFFIPESPRWLLANGKEKEGKKASERMAKINRNKISEETWMKAMKAGEVFISRASNQKKYTAFDLFRNRRMALITLNVAFNWFVVSFVYYGITLNAGALAGDIFVNNALSALFFEISEETFLNNFLDGVMDIVADFFCILLINRVGRKLLLSSSLLLAGLGLLVCVVVNNYAGDDRGLITFGVVVAFTSKFAISCAFEIIYVFTAELYPTVVRSNGMGTGSVAARIGGIIAPFLISLQDHASWVPNTIFGVFGVVAGLLSFAFPETNGQPLMESIEEAEEFYKNHKHVNRYLKKEKNNSCHEGQISMMIKL